MADETPDTTEEQVAATEAVDETTAAEAPAAEAPETEAAAPAEPVAPLTPKERKAASRARRGVRRGATPEERAEARKAKAAARSRYRANARAKRNEKRGEPGPAKTTSPIEHGPGSPKERLGTVVSDKADKTITVRIDVARRHRRYQKIVRSSTTLHAHDEANDANIGDVVRIIESRPLSATKRWRLVEILERAK
jgi:small subunit ribosomal protein S17